MNQSTEETDNEKDQFYQRARSWTYDSYHSHSVWLRRSIIALCTMAILLILSLALNLFLFPLKQKVPYLYAFNNATGEITKLGELEPTKLQGNWAMTRYFLTQYVINRESYNAENLEYPYQVTWAMSSDEVRKSYNAQVKSDRATSPIKLYGKGKYVTVDIKSISKLNESTTEVRFQKTLHDKATNLESVSHKAAIIKWKYTTPETTQRMLDQDPLGFKVTYYEVTQVNTD